MGGHWMPRIVWIALGALGVFGLLGITIPDMGLAGPRLALVALGGGAAALLMAVMAVLDAEADGRMVERERARQAATVRGRRRRRAHARTKRRVLAPVG